MISHPARHRTHPESSPDRQHRYRCDDIRAAIVVMLRADDPAEDPEVAEAAASFLAPEFEHLAEELFTAALGRGLVRLPKVAFYLFPDREEA